MLETVSSPTFTFRKVGMLFFSRRVPPHPEANLECSCALLDFSLGYCGGMAWPAKVRASWAAVERVSRR